LSKALHGLDYVLPAAASHRDGGHDRWLEERNFRDLYESLAICAVGVARPVRAAIFGHYGDHVGSKSTLIGTPLITGLGTFWTSGSELPAMEENQMQNRRKESILDIYSLLLALFLFATPSLFSYRNGNASIDVWASSAAVAAVSILTLIAFSIWQEWLNLLLGAWLIISPWVVGFTHTIAMHYSIGIGTAVAFLAAIELVLVHDAPTQDPIYRGSVRRRNLTGME
jgi:hypothetical protein